MRFGLRQTQPSAHGSMDGRVLEPAHTHEGLLDVIGVGTRGASQMTGELVRTDVVVLDTEALGRRQGSRVRQPRRGEPRATPGAITRAPDEEEQQLLPTTKHALQQTYPPRLYGDRVRSRRGHPRGGGGKT